jgi:xanthine/CO dehydrogenase XdhC/CoxF family maturation factor
VLLARSEEPLARLAAELGAEHEVCDVSDRAQVEQLAADYRAEEVIAVTITHDHAARRRSYELLAEAFDLPGVPVVGGAAGTADR